MRDYIPMKIEQTTEQALHLIQSLAESEQGLPVLYVMAKLAVLRGDLNVFVQPMSPDSDPEEGTQIYELTQQGRQRLVEAGLVDDVEALDA